MAHLGVGKLSRALQARALDRPGLEHPLLDDGRGLAVRGLGQGLQRHRGHLDVQVNPIQQGA